ncbi:unnamed protein product [Closterium sp. NIES-53]
MASLNVLTFDAEGRAVDFEVWLDDLQLFLQCDSKDGLSLFDLTSGASTAPTADADSTVRSQWLTRDAAARLAVRNHLPSTERTHFSQYKGARALYDAVVARYSSPTTADLAAFSTVADLVAHLRTSDARYRAALPTEFLPTNSPPMYITLYYLVTRLPDSLSSVRDHFLSLSPTELTVDLLEERLAAAEKSILAVGASRGDRRTPFFEGCSPVPLLPSVASAAAVDLVGTEKVGAASAPSGRRRTGKGKGSKGGGGGGGGSGGGGGGSGGCGPGGGGVGGGSGGRGGGGEGSGGGGSGAGGSGGGGAGRGAATQRGGLGGGQRQQQLRTRETPSVQQLREWYAGRGRSGGAGPCAYVLRTGNRSGEVCGLPHTTQRCFGRLTDAWRTQFSDAVELPRWHDLLLQNVPIFDLDFDAILAAMYALADITEGDCYLRVPPDPGTVAAALGASAAAALGASASAAPGAGTSPPSGTAPTESFHTFTLDSDPGEPVEVAVDSGAARGAATGGAKSGGAETGGAEPGRAELGGVTPEGTVSGGAEPARAASGGALGVPSRREPLSPQRLREWYSRRCRVAAGAAAAAAGAAGGAGGATGAPGGAGATGGAAGAGAAGGAAGTGAAGAAGGTAGATGGAGAAEGAAGATGGAGAARGAAGTGDPGAEGTGSVSAVSGGAARPWLYFVPLLQQVLGSPPFPGSPPPPFLSPPQVQSPSQLPPASPLPGPSPYSGLTGCLTERHEPESCPVSPESRPTSPVRTVRPGRVLRPRLPPVPGTHSMTLRPSTAPQRVPLPSPPASSLPDGPDPESDSLRAASPTLVDFAATCRLDYAASLVAESVSASVSPPSVGGECALGKDVLEDRQEDLECFAAASPHLVSMLLAPEGDPDALDIPTPRSYAEAIEGPYSSQWQAAMDAEMASWKSTGTYVDEVPPPGANIVNGMWIFRVKRPPGSPPAFKARYVARGFSQCQGIDFFQTFSPTPKMTTLRVLLHVAAQRDYELHSLDFGTTFLQGSLHEEIWLRRPLGFTRTTLAALGFAPSTADPSLFLRTDATLPPFYVLVYVDLLVFVTADTEALAHVKSELQKRHTCTDMGPLVLRLHLLLSTVHSSAYRSLALSSTFGRVRMGLVLGGRARVVLTGHADASWVDDLATQRSSQGYTLSLGSGSVSWWSTCSSSVLSSSCEAEIYAGAMAAQELRWLTYLLTDLGEAPRSPPVLYVDNKAMLALCQEQRLEHRTKHIALRYFLARELQQRGQLRLAYVASQANTADVFTKAL